MSQAVFRNRDRQWRRPHSRCAGGSAHYLLRRHLGTAVGHRAAAPVPAPVPVPVLFGLKVASAAVCVPGSDVGSGKEVDPSGTGSRPGWSATTARPGEFATFLAISGSGLAGCGGGGVTKIDPVPGSGATFALPPIRRAIVIERLERDTNDEVVGRHVIIPFTAYLLE